MAVFSVGEFSTVIVLKGSNINVHLKQLIVSLFPVKNITCNLLIYQFWIVSIVVELYSDKKKKSLLACNVKLIKPLNFIINYLNRFQS